MVGLCWKASNVCCLCIGQHKQQQQQLEDEEEETTIREIIARRSRYETKQEWFNKTINSSSMAKVNINKQSTKA